MRKREVGFEICRIETLVGGYADSIGAIKCCEGNCRCVLETCRFHWLPISNSFCHQDNANIYSGEAILCPNKFSPVLPQKA